MGDLISRKDALRAIEKHTAKDTMGFLDFERKAVFEWTKYDIYKIINDLPSANLQPSCNQLATNLQPTCVSRQTVLDAIDAIESEVEDGDGFQYEKWRQHFCELPSVEPKRKMGKWIGTEFDGYADGNPVYYEWKCSACGCVVEDEEPTWNYCPNCGADMRGEDDEAD